MEPMVVEMSSTVISNPVTSSNRVISRRKKIKKSLRNQTQSSNNNNNNNSDNTPSSTTTEWKTQAQQQVYSSKLLKALREVRISPPAPTAPKGGRAVREVADRVLAVTAKGRSRWSRAILTNRLKLKFMKKHAKRQKVAASCTTSRITRKPRVGILKLKTKNLPAFQKKARVLGRLVPGCRKQPLPVILDEATDYIAALEMQIRAMSALADLLSGASTSSTTTASQPPPS
ncbi:transcription factor bHLH148-like [Lycium barbarum]|uniref:transcription factor bHLH148-like n=1 Tax=Lycium barbarum TaxID=112863 RepID=UPI00293E050E|nr:transcription factor bHLH148-like [Lycium barbarum]